MTVAIKILSAVSALLWSAPAFGQEAKAPAAPEDREPVTLEIEGLVLEYVPRQLSRGRKTARAEMEAISSAEARIEVEKPIGYRRDRLSEGEYCLRVEREESGAAFLVVEPTPSAGEAARGGQAKEEGGNGDDSAEEAEVTPRATKDGDAQDAREKKKSSKTSESVGKAGKSGKTEKLEKAEPNLRWPLKFGPCEKSGDSLSFSLVSRGKSGRFFIVLRAGGTEARSPTLRFVEE